MRCFGQRSCYPPSYAKTPMASNTGGKYALGGSNVKAPPAPCAAKAPDRPGIGPAGGGAWPVAGGCWPGAGAVVRADRAMPAAARSGPGRRGRGRQARRLDCFTSGNRGSCLPLLVQDREGDTDKKTVILGKLRPQICISNIRPARADGPDFRPLPVFVTRGAGLAPRRTGARAVIGTLFKDAARANVSISGKRCFGGILTIISPKFRSLRGEFAAILPESPRAAPRGRGQFGRKSGARWTGQAGGRSGLSSPGRCQTRSRCAGHGRRGCRQWPR